LKASHTFVLLHSPLVGPITWKLVAEQMQQRGLDVLIPRLKDSPDSKVPYWKQHAESVSQALAETPKDTSLILVAHSGAGPLLPAVRQFVTNPIKAYVFVDTGIPRNGANRLDLMKSEDPAWAKQFEEGLRRGGRFPTWSSNDLREIIPDERLREQMVVEIQPRALDFFIEPIPVFDNWPDAPCAYIQFSGAYKKPADLARQLGWKTNEFKAGHFHMLIDAATVTNMIIEAVNKPG
jgi:hypothetical protein